MSRKKKGQDWPGDEYVDAGELLKNLPLGMRGYQCARCGAIVMQRFERAPKRCARCKSQYWRVPRGVLKRGRPRKNESD